MERIRPNVMSTEKALKLESYFGSELKYAFYRQAYLWVILSSTANLDSF